MIQAGRDLDTDVTVIVHQIDQAVHPTYPPGWRWAVHVGGSGPTDLDRCVNAGHQQTQELAAVVGESHGAAVTKALRLAEVKARYSVQKLGHDPIPASADQQPRTVWRGEGEG